MVSTSGEETPPPTNNNQNRPKPEPKHWLEYAIFVFVIVTAGATAWAAYYTTKQWCTADDTEKRSLRAYVGTVPGDIENFGDPKTQIFSLRIENFGNTPAYSVGHIDDISGAYKIGPSAILRPTMDNPCGKPDFPDLVTIFPHGHFIVPIPSMSVPPEQFQRVRNGEIGFFYSGVICYFDAFRRPRFTDYCWYWRGKRFTGEDAKGCTRHNDSN